MQYDPACDRICGDIAALLMELRPRTSGAAYAAACATRSVAAAFHHAAGLPDDALWHEALDSLEFFLAVCDRSATPQAAAASRELRRFVQENADLLKPRYQLALAS
jgi:hypothetical protein